MKIIRPSTMSNVSLVSSTVAALDPDAAGYWDTTAAYSVGAIRQVDSAGTTPPAVTFTASGKVLTCTAAHYLYNNSMVSLTNSGGALPTGLSAGVLYYVVNGATASDWSTRLTLNLSLTKGGAPIITTDAGTGTHTMLTDSTELWTATVSSK